MKQYKHDVYSACPFALVLVLLLTQPLFAQAAAANPPVDGPLQIGSKAIDFELPIVGQDGYVRLQDEYRKGPVVVVVLRGYPGYQCPLCREQMSGFLNRAKRLSEVCERVIFVYPGDDKLLRRRAEQFIGSRRIADPIVVVHDDPMKMVESWGLRWNSPRETAYPATYVINQYGRVTWSKISESHGGRSSTEEVIRELRKLQK